jgi:hypothetical protein
MGLAGFNRMRRSRLPVEELETERFKKDNAARWARKRGQDDSNKQDPKVLDKIAEAETAAAEEIGRKVEEGIKMGEEGGVADLPLRRDHAAEIAGRTPQTDPREPMDPMDRLHERIPPKETANEKLAEHMSVNQPGPTIEQVKAAAVEMAPPNEKKSAAAAIDAQNAPAVARHEAAVEAKAERREAEKKAGEPTATESAKSDAKAAEADVARRETETKAAAIKAAEKTPAQVKAEADAKKASVEKSLPAAGKAPDVGSKK